MGKKWALKAAEREGMLEPQEEWRKWRQGELSPALLQESESLGDIPGGRPISGLRHGPPSSRPYGLWSRGRTIPQSGHHLAPLGNLLHRSVTLCVVAHWETAPRGTRCGLNKCVLFAFRPRGCSPARTPGCRVPIGSPFLLGHIQPLHLPLIHTDPGLPPGACGL